MTSHNDIRSKPDVYIWATEIYFVVRGVNFVNVLEESSLSLLWKEKFILTLQQQKNVDPGLEAEGAEGWLLRIDATDKACQAEMLGTRLAYSLLLLAIEHHWAVGLDWPDSTLPCRVIDRTKPDGLAISSALGRHTRNVKLDDLVDGIEKGFSTYEVVPYRLLLSMELCVSSRFEHNSRSRLILLVSALETLAEQTDMTDKLQPLLDKLDQVVDEFSFVDSPEGISLKSSLRGQIQNLKRESVRRAIKRFIAEAGLSKDDGKFIESAYDVRSKIVHEGERVQSLGTMISRLERILKIIYVQMATSKRNVK